MHILLLGKVCIILVLKKVHIITLRSNNLTENNY